MNDPLLRRTFTVDPAHFETMAAGSGGRFSAADIAAHVADGRMQAWTPDDPSLSCVLVTNVADYPQFKALRCIGIVGALPDQWRDMLTELERIAREDLFCTRIEALHPPDKYGILPMLGWSVFHVLSEKAL